MYHYFDDKDFLADMRKLYGDILQSLCHFLKEDFDIGANFYLVGSGARNLVVQNRFNPFDLDYNLEILRCCDFDDCKYIKESVRKSFNKALRQFGLPDCEDSTSSLTSKHFRYNFSVDVCITARDEKDNYYRLIHKKTGWPDEYYWNIVAKKISKVEKKVKLIKDENEWELVRSQYIQIKNRYLSQNDTTHPSFICYIEAVNNVYNSIT